MTSVATTPDSPTTRVLIVYTPASVTGSRGRSLPPSAPDDPVRRGVVSSSGVETQNPSKTQWDTLLHNKGK